MPVDELHVRSPRIRAALAAVRVSDNAPELRRCTSKQHNPSLAVLRRLAAALGADIAELVK